MTSSHDSFAAAARTCELSLKAVKASLGALLKRSPRAAARSA